MSESNELFLTAEERPLHELTFIRSRNRKGKNETDVREEIKEQAKLIGLERKLVYATLIYTGLRKSELASISIGQIDDPKNKFKHLTETKTKSDYETAQSVLHNSKYSKGYETSGFPNRPKNRWDNKKNRSSAKDSPAFVYSQYLCSLEIIDVKCWSCTIIFI